MTAPFQHYREAASKEEEARGINSRIADVLAYFDGKSFSDAGVGADKCFREAIGLMRNGNHSVSLLCSDENKANRDAKNCLLISGCVYIKFGMCFKPIEDRIDKASLPDNDLKHLLWHGKKVNDGMGLGL